MKRAIAILFLMLAADVAAVSIGAGPSTIDYGKLVRGGYGEKDITVSTNSIENLTCFIEYTGDIKEWMASDEGDTFDLAGNNRKTITFFIQPPESAANGKYDGAIYIRASPTSTVESGAGMAVGAGVKIIVSAEITGVQERSFEVKSVRIDEAEVGQPIPLTIGVKNTGNVKVNPIFQLRVLDKGQNELYDTEYSEKDLWPMREDEIKVDLPSDGIKAGAYVLNMKAYSQDKLIDEWDKEFAIEPAGTISVGGNLKEIRVSTMIAKVGEPVKVTAVFENNGATHIEAKLKSEVYVSGGLEEVLDDSDEYMVAPGEEIELETYFEPERSGNFMVQGFVLYKGKKTDVKQVTMTAVGGGMEDYMYYAIAAGIAMILVYAVKRRVS